MWRKGEKRGRRVSDSGRERESEGEREREGERAPVSWEVQTVGGGGGSGHML